MYTLTDSGLTIPDPEAFGFDGSDLSSAAFTVASNEYVRDRRSYNIHCLVIRHEESGRFFATEYSTHEDEGFEWGPGMGRDAATEWGEVRPRATTVIVYE